LATLIDQTINFK